MSEFLPSTETPMSHGGHAHYVRTQEYISAPKYPPGAGMQSSLNYFNMEQLQDESEIVVVDNKIFNASTHQFAEGDFICPGFFSLTSLDGFTRRFNYAQWNYEMRREAQPVLPFLSLGPFSCLRNYDFLRKQGFTLLLAIRNRHSAHARLLSGDKAAAALGIQADTIDVLDSQELISAFPRAIRRINDHLAGTDALSHGAPNSTSLTSHCSSSDKRKVLLFCESGNERSAAVAIAYIMVMLNMDAIRATHMVQQHRFCISIEDPLKRILAAFESILAAKRDVERAKRINPQFGATMLAPPPVPPVVLAKKRSFADRKEEESDILDTEMDVDGEEDLLGARRPFAPFQDRVA
ncbi:hypothetical protein N7462_005635 [Penicillium macrosclerotiorum]|uniref:uncharacterized protein n=1 Tax=Penicillium macrosclerotiorum TaxID=303699 RepID=UPI0025494624|nr:uncharacterized protein N7462_005635 [Penicillium macrosclerotiorum]KAJ5682470.1 hypothetical protein N7462_005635 [Penicillium macrosclerotiorum]